MIEQSSSGLKHGPNSSRIIVGNSKEDALVDPLTSTRVINSANCVFGANTIVAYWPFSIKSGTSNHQEKFLHFSLPTFGFFLSCLYVALNIIYTVYYFLFRLKPELKYMPIFDLVLMTTWDLLVVVCVTSHRIYGLMQLSKFRSFWDTILSVVSQCTFLTCERDTELALSRFKRWTIKWFVIFTALGIVDCLSVVYTNTVVSPESVITVFMYVYIEALTCMHNASALMLIYFIKITTHGFLTCKRKLDHMSLTQSQISEILKGSRNIQHNNKGDVLRLTTRVPLLDGVFKLIDELEKCVDGFNKLFGFSLFLDTFLFFWQVLFGLYFLHAHTIRDVAFAINMLIPILVYPACFICLCVAASKLNAECQGMIQSFQKLSPDIISRDDSYKVQLLVTRISSVPPCIRVAQLFEIRESLLGSALNTLATYFIVLVQMKQFSK